MSRIVMQDRWKTAHLPVLIALALIIGLLLLIVLQSSAAASETVNAVLDKGGTLSVSGEPNRAVQIGCPDGLVRVDGRHPSSGVAACGSITALELRGGLTPDPGLLTNGAFANLTRIRIEGTEGADAQTLIRGRAQGTEPALWVEQPVALGRPPGAQAAASALSAARSAGHAGPSGIAASAPPLSSTIPGITFDDDGSNNGGFYHIPPDPIAAAGPSHVVSVVNTSIEWHTKAGVQQNSQSLSSFFSSLSPATDTFDPKVIYDQYNDRFVVVTLEQTDTAFGDPADTSLIFVAVSDDSDPNGTWYFHSINSIVNISGTDHWADYPGLAVDSQAVYITNNMFTFASNLSNGVRLWIVEKGAGAGGFYDGGSTTVNIFDPDAASGAPFFLSFALQPAHMFGTPPAGVGTFLVMYDGITDGVNEALRVIRVDDPTGTPVFTHAFVNVGDIDNTMTGMPDAPQNGSPVNIETNDRRALNAVWRDNTLWTTAQVVPGAGPDLGQATAHWFRLDTTNLAALSVTDQGDVGGNDIDAGAHTFMPSIMVDQSGNMAMGFSLSSPNHYAGAYYTCRAATDPAGSVQSTGVLAAGQDFYVRTFSGDKNRWGDYSGTALDPADESTFWLFNEYAMTRGTIIGLEDGRWATQYGSFQCQSLFPNNMYLPIVIKN